jgi:hypothetical protein
MIGRYNALQRVETTQANPLRVFIREIALPRPQNNHKKMSSNKPTYYTDLIKNSVSAHKKDGDTDKKENNDNEKAPTKTNSIEYAISSMALINNNANDESSKSGKTESNGSANQRDATEEGTPKNAIGTFETAPVEDDEFYDVLNDSDWFEKAADEPVVPLTSTANPVSNHPLKIKTEESDEDTIMTEGTSSLAGHTKHIPQKQTADNSGPRKKPKLSNLAPTDEVVTHYTHYKEPSKSLQTHGNVGSSSSHASESSANPKPTKKKPDVTTDEYLGIVTKKEEIEKPKNNQVGSKTEYLLNNTRPSHGGKSISLLDRPTTEPDRPTTAIREALEIYPNGEDGEYKCDDLESVEKNKEDFIKMSVKFKHYKSIGKGCKRERIETNKKKCGDESTVIIIPPSGTISPNLPAQWTVANMGLAYSIKQRCFFTCFYNRTGGIFRYFLDPSSDFCMALAMRNSGDDENVEIKYANLNNFRSFGWYHEALRAAGGRVMVPHVPSYLLLGMEQSSMKEAYSRLVKSIEEREKTVVEKDNNTPKKKSGKKRIKSEKSDDETASHEEAESVVDDDEDNTVSIKAEDDEESTAPTRTKKCSSSKDDKHLKAYRENIGDLTIEELKVFGSVLRKILRKKK